MRVTINMSDELAKLCDEEAARLNISRSAFICVCCSSDLNAYYRRYDEEYLKDAFIDKMEHNESVAKILGKVYDEQLKDDN